MAQLTAPVQCHCGAEYQATEKVDIDHTLDPWGRWRRLEQDETMEFNIYCANDHAVTRDSELYAQLYELRDEPLS